MYPAKRYLSRHLSAWSGKSPFIQLGASLRRNPWRDVIFTNGRMGHRIALAIACMVFLLATSHAAAMNITGWWRMETDNDPGAGYSVPNEVIDGPALIG